jgi:outer membrane protein assembly factor BamA
LDPGVVEILGHREDEEDEEEQARDSREYDGRLLPLAKLDSSRDYLCSDIEVINVEGMELMEDEEFLGFMPGTRVNKSDIMEAKKQLMATGWYKAVNVRWIAESEDAIKLIFITEDAVYNNSSLFRCVSEDNKCVLPRAIQRDITSMLRREENVPKQTLSDIQDRIEGWYRDEGYVYAKVKGFRTSESGVLECNVDEGRISRISISCEDEAGQPAACYTDKEILLESLPSAGAWHRTAPSLEREPPAVC